MRCYYVLVHGQLEWLVPLSEEEGASQPSGFYCYRYVLAANQADAATRALQRVAHQFHKICDWVTTMNANLVLEADDVSEAAFYMLLKPDMRNHIIYDEHD